MDFFTEMRKLLGPECQDKECGDLDGRHPYHFFNRRLEDATCLLRRVFFQAHRLAPNLAHDIDVFLSP